MSAVGPSTVILGIESSCDETAAAVVVGGHEVRSSVVSSQIDLHARFGGEVVLDTERGRLLHETGLLPALYVPEDDVRTDLLERTDHSTHCPFKGDAAYWTIRVGDRVAENAVWGYPEPLPESSWLRGYMAFYWAPMDAWYDEDERVHGHLRDPFHRVDARASSRPRPVKRAT